MKNPVFLIVLFAILVSVSSCKKEVFQPPHNHTATTPNIYSDYPTNYLQIGNYWVYEKYEAQATYIDSVSVESLIIKNETDSFYCLVHHIYGGYKYTYCEYAHITEAGLLVDTSGKIIYDYSTLPYNTDSGTRSTAKCNWRWGQFSWGSDATVSTECGNLIGRNYSRNQYTEDYCTNYIGIETYVIARGVGVVSFDNSCMAPSTAVLGSRLRRFFVRH